MIQKTPLKQRVSLLVSIGALCLIGHLLSRNTYWGCQNFLSPPSETKHNDQSLLNPKSSDDPGLLEISSEYLTRRDNLPYNFDRDLRFGPIYRVKTSSELNVEVITILYDYIDSIDSKQGEAMICRFVAYDNRGDSIIGDRFTRLYQFTPHIGKVQWRASGEIMTGVRGIGLASAIERVHMDVLQKIADSTGLKVIWTADNDNLRKLETKKSLYQKYPTNQLLKEIERLEKEQQRWHALYGVGGKLGLDQDLQRVFLPNQQNAPPLEAIGDIDLEQEHTSTTVPLNLLYHHRLEKFRKIFRLRLPDLDPTIESAL